MEALIAVATPLIQKAEGFRQFPYVDTTGHWTIGFGHSLSANGINLKTGEFILQSDLENALAACKAKIDFFDKLDLARQYILLNMAFNMGIGGLLAFEKMLNAMRIGEFNDAAVELRNSLEFKQVPNRITPLINIMQTGKLN